MAQKNKSKQGKRAPAYSADSLAVHLLLGLILIALGLLIVFGKAELLSAAQGIADCQNQTDCDDQTVKTDFKGTDGEAGGGI